MDEQVRPAAPRRGAGGYEKGEQTRRRLLDVALAAFGRSGYAATTTRRIVDEAGLNLPALSYYFGDKEGLYLACAQEIVERFKRATGPTAEAARTALAQPMSHEQARAQLKAVMGALAALITTADVERGASFVRQETANPGPAFEVLYAQLWRPGVELVASLIACSVRREMADDEATIRAVMMISSVTAFERGRSVLSGPSGQDTVSERARAVVAAVIQEQIDALGR
ncbi:MAG TPA: CerR family C-terminal domain-containing protein [Pseudonocardiaceae bacterium]